MPLTDPSTAPDATGQIKVGATEQEGPGFAPDFADDVETLAAARVFTLRPGETLTQAWDPISLYLDLEQIDEAWVLVEEASARLESGPPSG